MQALIAARLDTLPPERKSLLQDAAVVGKVFWAGALAEMGGRDAARGRAGPARLARKELVRPARTSLDGGRARVRVLAPARARRLLRPDPARRPRCPPPGGRRVDRGKAGERVGGPRRRARAPLPARRSSSPAPPARRTSRRCSRRRRPLPRPRGRAGAPARRRERRGAARASARVAPPGHPRTRLPARALGAGGAAAGRLQEARPALEEALTSIGSGASESPPVVS